MRVKDESSYILVGSKGGALENPVWVYNLRANGDVEIRDMTEVHEMRVREVEDAEERGAVVGPGGGGVPALRGLPAEDGAYYPAIRRGAHVGPPEAGIQGRQ